MEGEALASKFELYINLIASMANTLMGTMWNLDLGASFHMNGCKEFFSDLEEKYLQMNIEFGDNRKYSATEIGTITF